MKMTDSEVGQKFTNSSKATKAVNLIGYPDLELCSYKYPELF